MASGISNKVSAIAISSFIALALLACSGANPNSAANAQTIAGEPMSHHEMLRTISVSGSGEATATPDMAIVTLAVESRAKDAAGALAENAKSMTAVMAELKKLGIAEKDMQSSGLYLNADYDYSNGSRENKLIGHIANASLTVKVRDISKAGMIIDRGVASGANQLNGLSFAIADDTKLVEAARKAAIADAKARASLYANEAGVKVGKVIAISESFSSSPVPMPMVRGAKMEMDASTPLAAGENSISAQVSMVFAIE